jgi:hypothetical protein
MFSRSLGFTVILALFHWSAFATDVNGVRIAPGAKVDVVFYTAVDCRYCNDWKRQSKNAALDNLKKARVAFHEVDKARIAMPYSESHFPLEAKFAWTQLQASGRYNFTIPRWTIFADQKAVLTGVGTGDWSKVMRFLGDVTEARDAGK